MSGGHGGGPSWDPLLIQIGVVIVGLWILWFFSGGPERAARQGDLPFTNAPTPMGNGQVYDANGNSASQ